MPGRFIVLEGPDGSGTTTQCEFLAEKLKAEGHDVLLTAEPTSGDIGASIREWLKSGTLSPDALQLLFIADRAEHVEKIIRPALHAGKIVICDRYIPSTILYGVSQGLHAEWLEACNSLFIRPDLTLMALPPLELCLKRIAKREQKDIFETEHIQRKLHILYRAYAESHPEIGVIDTSALKEETANLVYSIVKDKVL